MAVGGRVDVLSQIGIVDTLSVFATLAIHSQWYPSDREIIPVCFGRCLGGAISQSERLSYRHCRP